MNNLSFSQLSPNPRHHQNQAASQTILKLWQDFYQNPEHIPGLEICLTTLNQQNRQKYQQKWQVIAQNPNDDQSLTDWLIELFNLLFNNTNLNQTPTILVRGEAEPEYFASQNGQPARIEFAHGYFASALHEVSHWCIAGKHRRNLNDFGYWYDADGRSQEKQNLFEQVEIKPQAIECLFSLACGRYFYVSQDNLNANFDTSTSTFAQDVYQQTLNYLKQPQNLPTDAKRLLWILLDLCQTSSE